MKCLDLYSQHNEFGRTDVSRRSCDLNSKQKSGFSFSPESCSPSPAPLFSWLTVSSELIGDSRTLACRHRRLSRQFPGPRTSYSLVFHPFSDWHVTRVSCPKSERAGPWPRCLCWPDLAVATDTEGTGVFVFLPF